jgi:hypothetical protein
MKGADVLTGPYVGLDVKLDEMIAALPEENSQRARLMGLKLQLERGSLPEGQAIKDVEKSVRALINLLGEDFGGTDQINTYKAFAVSKGGGAVSLEV